MSLATRCPTCATAFRVVQDQLRVSSGWVRCGRCGEVFNASESLVDIDAEPPSPATSSPPGAALVQRIDPTWQVPGRPASMAAPPPAVAAPPAPTPPPEPVPAPAPAPFVAEADAPIPVPEVIDDAEPAPAAPDVAGRVTDEPVVDEPVGADSQPGIPSAVVTASDAAPSEDDRVDSELIDSAMDETDSPDLPPSLVTEQPDSQLDEAEAEPLPTFVRQADRAARWRRPWVRALLSLVVLALGAALLAQVALVQRDLLAARMPALKPTLAALCDAAGCRIEPPRRIDQLAVESSGLARIEGAPLYRLSLVLRNRADIALLLPAVELTITDASGQVVSRRVLSPAEAGAAQDTLAGGQELALGATLSVAERRLAGYTIELFYP